MSTEDDRETIEPTPEEVAEAESWEKWTDHRGDRDKDGHVRHPWRGREVE